MPSPIRRLFPNQPVFTGRPRPLPEYRLTNQPFTAEQLKLGRAGLAGEPMGDIAWLPDGEHWLQVKEGKLWKIVAKTGRAVELFVEVRKLELSLAGLPGIDYKALPKQLAVPHYTFDPTFKAIFLRHNKSNYVAFRDGSNGFELGECEVPSFSPDGKLLAFVRNGNLHVGNFKNGKVEQITTDGGKNDILNGKADWVYEEEIFHRKGQAYWWAPDSEQIAFLRFDDSWVRKFALTHNDQLHSSVETISYPKSGEPNPLVVIGVVKVTDEKPEAKFLKLEGYKPADTIISRVGWVPGEKPVPFAFVQNRSQTWLDMVRWLEVNETQTKMFREETGAWVEDLGEPKWRLNGSFVLLRNANGHKHIHHMDKNGKILVQATRGNYDVREILRHDPPNYLVNYLSNRIFPAGASLESISYFRELAQLDVTPWAGPGKIDTAKFSPNDRLFMLNENKVDDPGATILGDLKGVGPRSRRVLNSNPVYERERFRFGKYERTKIKTRDGFEMEAAITYPPDFHELNKYPIWMLTYGGPNAPTIKDGWGGGRVFEQILAAQGIVVVRVDPQSASGKGMVNSKVCYKQLGVKELQDLEDAVDWLAKKPWADTTRVGLSGHSYGGFLTAFALTHSKKFSAGIAGAPVTDWRLYDSIYTERYMGLPSENKEGYDKTSVIKAAKDLHGELLIVHGMIDDNVHAQNSLQLIAALQKAGKDFEVMVYPDDRHGIAGLHYPQTQLKFILKTMGVKK